MFTPDLFDLSTDRCPPLQPSCCEIKQELEKLRGVFGRLRGYWLKCDEDLDDWTAEDCERLAEIVRLLDMLPITPAPYAQDQCETGLSPREAEILRWMARGKSNSVIADILGISPHTVDTHIRRIYRKLGAADRITAALRAMETGLLAEA